MARPRRPQAELSAQLGDLDDSELLKDWVPPPVWDRAEDLADALTAELRQQGLRRATRGDLLASLIHHAPMDGKKLASALQTYRHDYVWKTLGSKIKTGRVLLRERKRGRPSR